jgi:beta-lactamase regulating signal transducer with metallopeptidase domain
VSSEVLGALSAEQLDAAMRHERAHGVAGDNLKRLVLLLLPDVLPFQRSLDALEHGWAMFTEWAADDEAVAGDSVHALSLASALVRVARIGAGPALPLMSSFTAGGRELEARVDRLLRMETAGHLPPATGRVLLCCAAVISAGSMAVLLFLPGVLAAVHEALEYLVR